MYIFYFSYKILVVEKLSDECAIFSEADHYGAVNYKLVKSTDLWHSILTINECVVMYITSN